MWKILGFSLFLVLWINLALGQSTNFVDKDAKLRNFYEPQWFKDNIPFVEVPDKEIEDVYYYRFSSLKRHLRYTLPGAGYIVTEFVHRVGYAQKFDTINAAAGHHIDEARWLRNTRYVKDYVNFWTREGGNGNQQYSEWIADAAYNAFLVNGDTDFIKSQQAGLVENFNGWNDRFEPAINLYFLSPHDDAMEQSASSIQTDDPYHGGLGYRPSFNAEMFANAKAIANIARLNNDTTTAQEFDARAEAIRKGILDRLWDKERLFFYHVFREGNPNYDLLDTREEIGFFPWRWDVPPKDDPQFNRAWEHLFDPQGFDTVYGPTTCERRSQWFDGEQISTCCWWNGNSWPYSTGHTLRAIAAQVKRYASTAYANVESFVAVLHKYAFTQYRDGSPYVAECHSALHDWWVCDSFNHSEHYAHSTYTDNVLADLIGIEPQEDDTFQVNPLIPSSWRYFIAENIPYHGHNITVLYDADGTKYQTGAGLQIFVNGVTQAVQPAVGLMKISIPPRRPTQSNGEKNKLENFAANVNEFGYPMVDSSFTSVDASPWQVTDGRILYDHIPSNRWTNYGSPNPTDWFSVNFGPGRQKTVSQVKVYVYSDIESGHDVACATNIAIEYSVAGFWLPVANQQATPVRCPPNDVWTFDFSPVTAQSLRLVVARNVLNNTFVGFTEVEIWGSWAHDDGTYEAEDGFLQDSNIQASSSASGGSFVGQIDDNNAYVEFTGVWVDQEGTYPIRIYYSNGGNAPATLAMSANNLSTEDVVFPQSTTTWGEFDPTVFVQLQVKLQRGNNVLIFKHKTNSAELDRIQIVQ